MAAFNRPDKYTGAWNLRATNRAPSMRKSSCMCHDGCCYPLSSVMTNKGRIAMAAKQLLEMLADDLMKKEREIIHYIENSCRGDEPSKVYARTIANGRLEQLRSDQRLVEQYRAAAQ